MSTLRSKTVEQLNYCLHYADEKKAEFKLPFTIIKNARQLLRGIVTLPNKAIIRNTLLFLWKNDADKSTLEIEIWENKVLITFDSKSKKQICHQEYSLDDLDQTITHVRHYVDRLVEEHLSNVVFLAA